MMFLMIKGLGAVDYGSKPFRKAEMRKKSLLLLLVLLMSFTAGCGKKVKEKQISVVINSRTESVKYKGNLENGKPSGKGTCTAEGWGLSADFQDGKVVSGSITDYPIDIHFAGRDISCIYSGDIRNGSLTGKGEIYSGVSGFEYTGDVEEGRLSGSGKLEYSHYSVHSSGEEREGTFFGETKDGLPDGTGTFTTTDKGKAYTYTGEWKDGTFNGTGKKEYADGKTPAENGYFANGEFLPTAAEFIRYAGTMDSPRFVPEEKAEAFIEANGELFLKNDPEIPEDLVDPELTYEKYKKSPQDYGDRLMKLENCSVDQIWEYPLFQYDHVSELSLSARQGEKKYYVFFLNTTPGIIEGNKVTVYGLPVAFHVSGDGDGEKDECCIMLAVYIK